MRILFASDAPSIHTRRWVEYFRDQGAEVHVASFRPFTIEGVSVHVLPSFGLGKLGYIYSVITLRKLCKSLKPDIVHAQYVTSYGFFAALAGLRPLVVTAWGTDVLISPRESRLSRFFARYAVMHADAITTVAEHMNTSVTELGVPSNKVEAIPFGVDTQMFHLYEDAGSHEPLKLICTRNFGEIYDVQTLIKALAKVHERGYGLEVTLTGDGPLRHSLEDLTRSLQLKNVHFLGHVDQPTLAALLANSDIFVTPALSDGNNVSLNEAMACGCFPVATDIPANQQWLENGVNGYLYRPGDVDQLAEAIVQAIDNAQLRTTAREKNRNIVQERADWRVCVKRMENIYNQLSSSSPK